MTEQTDKPHQPRFHDRGVPAVDHPPIDEILELERIEKNIYRGIAVESYLPRTFGGQVAGQALVAATRTADERYLVHSLHGYFIRPGNPKQPIVYVVDRMRDGRSFCTRRVDAIQDGKTIFTMEASFHVPEEGGLRHQDEMPPAPLPEELPDYAELPEAERETWMAEWSDWDIRPVPPEQTRTMPGLAAQQRVWIRYRRKLPDVNILHVCALAYLSDMTLLGSARVPHPGVEIQAASLDHALWFLRPFRADEWLLYDQTSPSAGYGRALTQGRIYNRSGDMVAAVTQEGLTRIARDS